MRFSSQLAFLTLIAHFVLAAHIASHFSQASEDAASPQCAICVAGRTAVGVPAIEIVAGPHAVAWAQELASLQAPAMGRLDRATPPRAPPIVIPATTIG